MRHLAVAAVALAACQRGPSTGGGGHGHARVGDRDRSYALHVPAQRPAHPALVIVLHGSTQDGDAVRATFGNELDALADANGFVVMYPDGYRGNWDDCRKAATYPARTEHVDDVAFVDALIDRAAADYGVDRARVFAVGYSNGAQMAFRLGLEQPDRFAAIAAVSAGLPTDDNNDCTIAGRPVAAMLFDGTDDPLNPFDGGDVHDRGTVRSVQDTAHYFAGSGAAPAHVERLAHRDASDPTSVERSEWSTPGRPAVVLYAIHGGGHVVPQLVTPQRAALGHVTHDVDAPAEIWRFFASR